MRTTGRRRTNLTAPAAAACLLLALGLWLPAEVRAQWTTDTGAQKTTTTDKVGVGTATPDANAKLHVYNAPSAGVDIQSSSGGGWSRLRLVTGTRAYGWYTGDASNPDAPNKLGLYDYTAGAFRMMVDSSGKVGIGTTSPGSLLEVRRDQATAGTEVRVSNDAAGGFAGLYLNGGFAQTAGGLVQWNNTTNYQNLFVATGGNYPFHLGTNNNIRMTIMPTTGYVGIGTSAPAQQLHVNGSGTWAGARFTTAGTGGTINDGVSFGYDETSGTYIWNREATPVLFGVGNAEKMRIDASGNVGVGKADPTVRLDVEGAIRATGAITGATVSATYQDVAEWVPSTQKLLPGTVVILDAGRTNHVVASAGAYDTKVAGVVSAVPGLILGVAGEGKVMVATTGRVKVRVDATRGAIKVGDLLVTGEGVGVAMRSEPILIGGRQMHAPGTIIGKALEPLEKGAGEILILLSLQ